MADVREIKVRVGTDHWVRVDEFIFRSWTGPRRLNGETYLGPVYLLGSDTWSWPSDDTADEIRERQWEHDFDCAFHVMKNEVYCDCQQRRRAKLKIDSPRYTVYGADRAGDTWECRQIENPVEVASLLLGLRRFNPHNVFGVYLTDDPEHGDVEEEIDEEVLNIAREADQRA